MWVFQAWSIPSNLTIARCVAVKRLSWGSGLSCPKVKEQKLGPQTEWLPSSGSFLAVSTSTRGISEWCTYCKLLWGQWAIEKRGHLNKAIKGMCPLPPQVTSSVRDSYLSISFQCQLKYFKSWRPPSASLTCQNHSERMMLINSKPLSIFHFLNYHKVFLVFPAILIFIFGLLNPAILLQV